MSEIRKSRSKVLWSKAQEDTSLSQRMFERVLDFSKKTKGNLVGGAIRDMYLFKDISQVKDLDVFYSSPYDEDGILEKAENLGEWIHLSKGALETSNVRDNVNSITKFNNGLLDLVFCKETCVRDIVKAFDSSICQAWIEHSPCGTPHLYVSKDFLDYAIFRKWYVYEDVPTTQNHLDRLVAKFGPYKTKPTCKMKVYDMGDLNIIARGHCWWKSF